MSLNYDDFWTINSTANGLGPTDRLVMTLLLAHRNDGTGKCCPSQATLADEAGLSENAVYKVLKRLEAYGAVSRTSVLAGRYGRYTNFELHLDSLPSYVVRESYEVRDSYEVRPTPLLGKVGSLTKSGRKNKERTKQRSNTDSAIDVVFDELWREYPRKVGKRAARRAWDRTTKSHDRDTVAAGVRRYVAYVSAAKIEWRYIKHLATLLGPDREWEDEWLPQGSVKAAKPTDRPSPTHVTPRELHGLRLAS